MRYITMRVQNWILKNGFFFVQQNKKNISKNNYRNKQKQKKIIKKVDLLINK
jgi:hypothetical protein